MINKPSHATEGNSKRVSIPCVLRVGNGSILSIRVSTAIIIIIQCPQERQLIQKTPVRLSAW